MTEELPRVLIVDDEPGMREGVSRLLKNRGFETGTAEDGNAALECLKQMQYPIVLVDLKMPGMDGFEFLERTQAFERKIICIIVSAFATIESAVQTTKMGAFDFVVKPFTPDDLMLVVNRAVEKWRLSRETARLRAERDAHLLQLATEKSRLRTIMQSMADGLLVVNIDGHVVLDNTAARRLLGRVDASCVSVPIETLIPNEEIYHEIQRLLDARDDTLFFLEWEPDNAEVAGIPMALRVKLASIKDESGRFLGVVVLLSDISEPKQYERMKTRFISMVAHEIRSPIGAVESYLNLFEDGIYLDNPERVREIARRCLDRTTALLALVEDLLEITRRDGPSRKKNIEKIDVAALLRDLVEFHRPSATERGIPMETEVAGERHVIDADPGDIERLIGNLISNAIKYNIDSGKVFIRLEGASDCIRLEVRDTGIGMTPEETKRLGEEFYRVKNSKTRAITGTGLGLSLVKKIVASYKGSLEIDSASGEGSSFRVSIPVRSKIPAAETRK
ncbi:MAG: response regulator [Acidobacteria bacterium]|nr:response regulator [Acidobacteriota bacterium]